MKPLSPTEIKCLVSSITLVNYTGRKTPAYCVTIGNLDLYFSYRTIIAFATPGNMRVSENLWSNTTGRHLGSVP